MSDSRKKDDILSSFQEGIESGNFEHLNDALNDVLENAAGVAGRTINSFVSSLLNFGQNASEAKERRLKEEERKRLMPMNSVYPGELRGNIFRILGAFILVISLAFLCFQLIRAVIVSYTTAAVYLKLVAKWIIPIVLGAFLLINGSRTRSLSQAYDKISAAFGNTPYASVQALAQKTQLSARRVLKVVDSAIQNHAYPKALITDDEKYVVLSKEAVPLLEEHLRQEEEEKLRKAEEAAWEEAYPGLADSHARIDELIGLSRKTRMSSNLKNNPVMKDELATLQKTLGNINDFLKDHPEQVPDLKSFLNYFVPTVEKLIVTYNELDAQPLQTATIRESKKEIEETMSSVNTAFENLYDSFFQSTALDVSSDITVLKTLFAQKGLNDEDFNAKR